MMPTCAIKILEKGLQVHLNVVVVPKVPCLNRSPHAVGFKNFYEGNFCFAISKDFDNGAARESVTQRIAGVSGSISLI